MPRPNQTARHRWISRPVPPLPHPSWSRSAEFGERRLPVAAISPADFWNRLGL